MEKQPTSKHFQFQQFVTANLILFGSNLRIKARKMNSFQFLTNRNLGIQDTVFISMKQREGEGFCP